MFVCCRFLLPQLDQDRIQHSASEDTAAVVSGDRPSQICTDVDGIRGESNGDRLLDSPLRDGFAVDRDSHRSPLAQATAVIVEVESHYMLTGRQLLSCLYRVDGTEPVIADLGLAIFEVKAQ